MIEGLSFYGLKGVAAAAGMVLVGVCWWFYARMTDTRKALFDHVAESTERLTKLELGLQHHADTHARMEQVDKEAHAKLEKMMCDLDDKVDAMKEQQAGMKEQQAEILGRLTRRWEESKR